MLVEDAAASLSSQIRREKYRWFSITRILPPRLPEMRKIARK
jgi:hypothetical protein